MKNVLLILLATCLTTTCLFGQATFNTIDSVDINNINAAVLVHGDMWWNPDSAYKPQCLYPNGSRKNINFAGAIWMSAYDAASQLHISAQTYRQGGNDYWPGPLDASDTLTYTTSANWAKIWKVYRTDIQYFQSLTTHTTANTPTAILTWPGKGNTNAQGNGGAPLTVITDMAPFIDLNSNGIYEPLLGEYPDVRGDEALWWVFSDNGPTHNQSNGIPLGVEVHASSYAYNRGTLIDNVVYYEYTFTNKSVNNYSNMRVAQWDDIDLGYYLDDFIGFDSTWRMGIDYSGTPCDGCGGGNPANSYGFDPPQSAITMIVLPGDYGASYVPAGSFTTYNNDYSAQGNPNHDTICNNYMRSKLYNSKSIANDFSSGTLPCGGFDSASTLNYLYSGDPSDSSQWSECICGNNPGSRRFILSSNDFTLNVGSSAKVVFAQIVADSAGGCPIANFSKIKIVADTAWGNYYHPPAPLPPNAIKNLAQTNTINIYPNPAHNFLYIENSGQNTGEESITFYNIIGQKLAVTISGSGNKKVADISGLPNGIYIVEYRNSNIQLTTKFIKD